VDVLGSHLHGGRNRLHIEIRISKIVANESLDTSQMVALQRRDLRALPYGAGHNGRKCFQHSRPQLHCLPLGQTGSIGQRIPKGTQQSAPGMHAPQAQRCHRIHIANASYRHGLGKDENTLLKLTIEAQLVRPRVAEERHIPRLQGG